MGDLAGPTMLEVTAAVEGLILPFLPFIALAVGLSLGVSLVRRIYAIFSDSSLPFYADQEVTTVSPPSLRWCRNCSALTSPLPSQYCIVCGAPMHLTVLPGPPDDDDPFIVTGPTRKL